MREDLQTIGNGLLLFALAASVVLGAALALGVAWRAFTWAAGIGG